MASGWTSIEKSKVAIKKVHLEAPKQDENSMAVTPVTPIDDFQPLPSFKRYAAVLVKKGLLEGWANFFWFNMVIYLIASNSVVN